LRRGKFPIVGNGAPKKLKYIEKTKFKFKILTSQQDLKSQSKISGSNFIWETIWELGFINLFPNL
jgi:hypothetical protein